jgi:C4-dicarboxylate-specific signal transduction histidine kinase
MSVPSEDVGQKELHYFGKVSASISHELKNVLAILNENAGLLQDFAAMAEQGQPLDPERIRRLAATMLEQIQRGDVILKRMNRFAHSADENRATVNLNELVTMVVELFQRTAVSQGVKVDVKTSAAAMTIKTDPFALETLLGSLLYQVTENAADIGSLRLELESVGDESQIKFSGLTNYIDQIMTILDSKDINALLSTLQARVSINQQNDLVITLPGSI